MKTEFKMPKRMKNEIMKSKKGREESGGNAEQACVRNCTRILEPLKVKSKTMDRNNI